MVKKICYFLIILPNTSFASNCGANPNCGLLSDLTGVFFWGFVILSGVNMILGDPIRGTAKVISIIMPFVIGFGLPIYLASTKSFEGWMWLVWILSWVGAYSYIELHCKFFPEDNK